jgi:hypothetical protein
VPLAPMPPLDDQALRSPGFRRGAPRRYLCQKPVEFSTSSAPPNYYLPSTVMLMRATPLPVIPITPAAAAVRSMMRPAM